MRSVVFKKLSAEGFRSLQLPVSLTLDQKGLTLVKGINGAGKTSIFSALNWCLFKVNLNGTANDKVQTWPHQRLEGYRGTRVVVEISVGGYDYMIARHINFKGTTKGLKGESKLMIFRKSSEEVTFEGDHLLGEAQHKNDQQAYIQQLIGLDGRMFANSILFGQRMSRLISASNDEKRKLFETLFELDFIEPAKKKAAEEKEALTLALSKIDQKLTSENSLKSRAEGQLIKDREIVETFEQRKKEAISELRDKEQEIANDCSNLDKELAIMRGRLPKSDDRSQVTELEGKVREAKAIRDELVQKVDNAKSVIRGHENEVTSVKQKIAKLENDLECVKENCPYCGSNLNKAEVAKTKKIIKTAIDTEKEVLKQLSKVTLPDLDKLNAESLKAETTYRNMDDDLYQLQESLKEVNSLRTDIARKESSLASGVQRLEDIRERIEREQQTEPPKVNLKATEDEIAEHERKINKLLELQSEASVSLEKVKWWNDKAFGAGGLKAFVFSAMLNQLNELTKKYASRLGLRVKFGIDLSKASKPFFTSCFMGEHEVDYEDLSGGQKQRIDVCLAFAMHDLVSSSAVDMNILILDEIFEGLDDEGIETAFDLIRLKAGDSKSVYVITHATLIDSLNAKTMYVDQDEYKCTYLR